MQLGMNFRQIKNILGEPISEMQDPGWGDYTLTYNINGKTVQFYAHTPDGPTYAATIYPH